MFSLMTETNFVPLGLKHGILIYSLQAEHDIISNYFDGITGALHKGFTLISGPILHQFIDSRRKCFKIYDKTIKALVENKSFR